jgi:hypothetical protein
VLVGVNTAALGADRAYTEGAVVTVGSVRTEPGMFDEYMKYLAGPYKQFMEEQKKAGIILDYGVFQATPRSPHDPDLYLTVTYKNMAALDGLDARTDPISEKIFGSLEQSNAATATRGKLRTLVGGETIRELVLK